MRIRVLSLIISFYSIVLNAQVTRQPITSDYAGLNAYNSSEADAFSFSSNQAALSSVKSFSAGLYSEKRFLLQDLNFYRAVLSIPTGSGNFGLRADYSGTVSYNQSSLGIAYARKLDSKVDMGVQFNYDLIKTATYGTAYSLNFEAGAIFHITGQFQAGIHVYNPTRSKFGKAAEERLPSVYSTGFGYNASDNFFIGAEIEKTEDQPVNVRSGIQYRFDQKIIARTGISANTSSFYFGIGILLGAFRVDATATVHPHLGVSPGLLLLFTSPDSN